MKKSLYTFDFESMYKKPKPIEAFPGLYEKKKQQLMLQMGLTKPEQRPQSAENVFKRRNNLEKTLNLKLLKQNEAIEQFDKDLQIRDDMTTNPSDEYRSPAINDEELSKTIMEKLFQQN